MAREVTQNVRSMYEEFPFPNTAYQHPVGPFAAYFAKRGKNGRSFLAQGINVLDAGCGTGMVISEVAKAFPESQFTGIDISRASLELAEARARELKLTNVKFQHADLLTFDLGRKFEVIMSWGVMHHLADWNMGMQRVAAHLKDDGYFALWLYGKHARYRLNLNQQLIDLLARPEEDWRARVDLAKKALVKFPEQAMACYFSCADKSIEHDFPVARDWILQHDQWIADQFVHPVENSPDIEDIQKLLQGGGFVLDNWLGVDESGSRYTQDPELLSRLQALSRPERLRALDLLLKPDHYFVIARKASGVESR